MFREEVKSFRFEKNIVLRSGDHGMGSLGLGSRLRDSGEDKRWWMLWLMGDIKLVN